MIIIVIGSTTDGAELAKRIAMVRQFHDEIIIVESDKELKEIEQKLAVEIPDNILAKKYEAYKLQAHSDPPLMFPERGVIPNKYQSLHKPIKHARQKKKR